MKELVGQHPLWGTLGGEMFGLGRCMKSGGLLDFITCAITRWIPRRSLQHCMFTFLLSKLCVHWGCFNYWIVYKYLTPLHLPFPPLFHPSSSPSCHSPTRTHTPVLVNRRLVRACRPLCPVMSVKQACPPTRVHWGLLLCLSPAGRLQQWQPRSRLLQARWVTDN